MELFSLLTNSLSGKCHMLWEGGVGKGRGEEVGFVLFCFNLSF